MTSVQEPIEARIMEYFRSKGRVQGLAYDTDLFKGGFVDSLFAFEVVVFLEETFGVRIENRQITLENFRCISAIADTVRRAGGA